MFFTFSPVTLLLVFLIILIYILIKNEQQSATRKQELEVYEKGSKLLEAPGPKSYPIIGNLHVMGGYEVPYQAFSALAKKYGNIIKLQLGSVKAIVVNGQENIREVLINKGHHYDARPNFERYHQLFSGDKENCKYYYQIPY